MKRPRFEDPSYCNAVLKSKLPPYGVTFTQRRARYLTSVLRILFKEEVPKDVIPSIANYAAQDFDRYDLSNAIQIKFIMDFPDYMDEDDLPLDSFDHIKHDYPICEFMFTRAYNVFYWWPSDQEEERKQELSFMCEHMNSLDNVAEFMQDKNFGLELGDVHFYYGSFKDEKIWDYVQKKLKLGDTKISINMWVHEEHE